MKTDKLNVWLSLGANVGVVVGLALLVLEIRQNTDMMEAQIMQSRTEAAMSEQQAMYNSDYMPQVGVKVVRGERLTDVEQFRYETWFRGSMRNFDNQLWQYDRGFLGSNIPRGLRGAVRAVIGSSQLARATWERQKGGYTDEYEAFVEETLADSLAQGR